VPGLTQDPTVIHYFILDVGQTVRVYSSSMTVVMSSPLYNFYSPNNGSKKKIQK